MDVIYSIRQEKNEPIENVHVSSLHTTSLITWKPATLSEVGVHLFCVWFVSSFSTLHLWFIYLLLRQLQRHVLIDCQYFFSELPTTNPYQPSYIFYEIFYATLSYDYPTKICKILLVLIVNSTQCLYHFLVQNVN